MTPNGTINLTGTYVGSVNTGFDATNLPSASTVVATAAMADGASAIDGYGDTGATVSGTGAAAAIELFDIPSLSEVWSIDAIFGTSRIDVAGRNANRSDATVDFSSINIPLLTNPNDSATNVGTTVTWMETGTGTADATYMDIDVQSVSPYLWHIAGPHVAGSLTLPTLPSGPFAAGNVTNTTSVRVSNMYLAQATGGWNALRANIFNTQSDQPAAFVKDVGDQVTMSFYFNDDCILGRGKNHHRRGAIHPCQ